VFSYYTVGKMAGAYRYNINGLIIIAV